MSKTRLEAFSDGVIAILITIMVLELRVPHGADWAALRPMLPVFLTYVLSFVYLGIYWNNHHHMLQPPTRINGAHSVGQSASALLAVARSVRDGWMGENHFAPLPTAVYGCVLLASAIAYTILQQTIIAEQGPGSRLKAAVGNDRKGKMSGLLYVIAIPLAFVHQGIADAIYVAVALIWLVPDRRIENHIKATTRTSAGAAGTFEDDAH